MKPPRGKRKPRRFFADFSDGAFVDSEVKSRDLVKLVAELTGKPRREVAHLLRSTRRIPQ